MLDADQYIFFEEEKTLSESAFDEEIDNNTAINLSRDGNIDCPSRVLIFPTSNQKAPACGFQPTAD